jgi:hypothetical protein
MNMKMLEKQGCGNFDEILTTYLFEPAMKV